MTYRKKMIEVSIPLDAINAESSREKSIRHGHPSTLHLWWARRPLAACRAVLFTSLIDDPGEEGVPQALLAAIDTLAAPDPLPADWDSVSIVDQRRARLFAFIGELVKWENTTNEVVIGKARELIMAATDGNPPPVLDPFCGGGSIPLEAQRLGLQAYASDLNPVAVLITKALVEIPPKFAGRPPVNPDDRKKMGAGVAWKGAAGLAADVRYYGKWMRDRAFEKIGHLYPKGPNGETVIAWLWARTVECPNPACGGLMPLVRSFWLSTKKGKEAWVEPIVDRAAKTVRFEVQTSRPRDADKIKAGTKTARGAKFTCAVCGQAANGQHIKDEGMAGRTGKQLLAVVAEGDRRRVYLSAHDMEEMPEPEIPDLHGIDSEIADDPRAIWCKLYGLTTFADLFTPRQLVALTTFSDLVGEARELACQHARDAGLPEDGVGIADGGTGAAGYADAVATYLALAVDRQANRGSTLSFWDSGYQKIQQGFARQAIPMTWDFSEVNPFSGSSGKWEGQVEGIVENLDHLSPGPPGLATQLNAAAAIDGVPGSMIATDPPYYDNIGYADLSDFFYVWLRRSLSELYPALFSTVLTPKEQELIATPYRFGGKRELAEAHFERGLTSAFALAREKSTTSAPMTLYYAFRQAEAKESAQSSSAFASTGWEKMLQALLTQGFTINGTWPMRTELAGNLKKGVNALASSIVLVCRPRAEDAPIATLREFTAALKSELPDALRHLIGGHVAPVDLSQASIGPGMAVFSHYSKVLEPNGEPMTVRRALELINQAVEEYFAEREGAFDPDTQFCVRWFEQHRFAAGPYGEAEVLSQAKNIGVDALARDGLLVSKGGKVQLQPLSYYQERVGSYDPAADTRLSAWEACHYLAAALREGGLSQAGRLARRLGGMAAQGVELAYRLYAICERKGWSEEGLAYNALADSWPAIQAAEREPEQIEAELET